MRKLFVLLSFILCFVFVHAAPFKLLQNQKSNTILIDKEEAPVVHTAIDILDSDIKKVSDVGAKIMLSDKDSDFDIIVGTVGKSRHIDQLLKQRLISDKKIKGQWEAFEIQVILQKNKQQLVVVGSDARGTAYGVLELSRLMGVSPWEWWADVVPAKKKELLLPDNYYDFQQPSVQYRGIFINDEDWGLMPWSTATFEPTDQKGRIGPKTYGKIFELLLRLRANILWPAMHECTVPFYFVYGNRQMADKYGIVLGTSHCEPLMRNSAGEWDAKKMGDYNYLTNKDAVQNYWIERLKETEHSENFYTVGMRGVHDGKMEGVKTLEEQTSVLTNVLKDQRELLKKHINKDVSSIPQAFIPYKEVLEIYDNNLDLADDVTLVWCDDNYGYITRLSNEQEQKRKGGSGVYYHISYWGRPHDYLWLSTTQPALTYWQMKNAWNNNVRKLWVLNVGDIKPAEYNIEFFMNMAWNIDSFSATNSKDRLAELFQRDFGNKGSTDIVDIMSEYYRLASVRKPEFMGWSRVEEYSAIKGGRTPVIDTEFNPYMFGDEIENRLNDYSIIENRVRELKSNIAKEELDAYFQLVEYPVLASAEMNKKLLYAQKARLYAKYSLPVANEYAAKSNEAYDRIVELTRIYNEGISNAKWKNFMDMKPRNLAVFQKSELPNHIESASGGNVLVWIENEDKPLSDNKEVIKLPDFIKSSDNKAFISLFQQGDKPVVWSIIEKPDWLNVNESKLDVKLEKRIEFSVDWNKISTDKVTSKCILKEGETIYTVSVEALNNKEKYTETNKAIALNGVDYSKGNANGLFVIKGLGHSDAAVELLPGKENVLEFDVYTTSEGKAILRTCLIPNHPVDKDLRFAVAIDDDDFQIVSMKTQFRSEPWKVNVLRNQAVHVSSHLLKSAGKHKIKIYALDRGIILDQLMLDFDLDRKFYQVPSKKNNH